MGSGQGEGLRLSLQFLMEAFMACTCFTFIHLSGENGNLQDRGNKKPVGREYLTSPESLLMSTLPKTSISEVLGA